MLRTAAVLCWVLAAGFGLLGFRPSPVSPAATASGRSSATRPTATVRSSGWACPPRCRCSWPSCMVFWIGFALPYGPMLGLLRTEFVILGRREAARTA
jgi:hypothetical protein